ncbi:uncharacterized protein LOC105250527 isoform X2 [Camponotus floridanus]|uniref:uncharacterized protein LOC105250527 isoform X2 n=1 Tax=Camponotus floridanus TaxID=104421 RepID=UPI00059C75E9|nr:uncharacterized protein LOC105250527 isoform X2 [Camponotus floridanus]
MPGCCVEKCCNRSEKGYRLFILPTGEKNSERREEWLQLIGKNTLGKRAAICEVHFGEDQFEKNRKDGRKLLRPFAVPNLLYNTNNEEEDNSEKAKSSNVIDVKDIVLHNEIILRYKEDENNANNINENSNVNFCGNVNDDNKTDISRHPETTDVEIFKKNESNHNIYDEQYVTNLKKTLTKIQMQCNIWKRKLRKSNAILKIARTFKKTLGKTKMKCNILKKRLRKSNAILETVFNKDQRNFMIYNTQKGTSWSADTITKALKLYVACGQKGYEEVRRQNLPYPSIRTLQHRIQGLKFKPGIFEDIFHLLKIKSLKTT